MYILVISFGKVPGFTLSVNTLLEISLHMPSILRSKDRNFLLSVI